MSTSNKNVNQNAPSSGKKKQPYKDDLPVELRDISPKDITSVVCALEVDKTTGKEVLMAQRIVHAGDTIIELSSLNVDQLRLLCRRLGITGSSSSKREACRRMIALCHNINENAAKQTDDPRSVEQQATNTLLRQVNLIFSSEFVQRFEELKDGRQEPTMRLATLPRNFGKTLLWLIMTLTLRKLSMSNPKMYM